MSKTKIFADFLKIISDETEIPTEKILSPSKEIDVVDARHLLIYALHRKGISTASIASMLNMSTRCINQAVTRFEGRLKSGKLLRFYLERIRNQCGMA